MRSIGYLTIQIAMTLGVAALPSGYVLAQALAQTFERVDADGVRQSLGAGFVFCQGEDCVKPSPKTLNKNSVHMTIKRHQAQSLGTREGKGMKPKQFTISKE